MYTTVDFSFTLQSEHIDMDYICSHPKVTVTDMRRRGEIAKRGRYKGRAYPDNCISFVPRDGQELGVDNIDILLEIIESDDELKKIIKASEDKDIFLGIFYVNQFNFALTPKQMFQMGQWGIDFLLSTYEDIPDEEE